MTKLRNLLIPTVLPALVVAVALVRAEAQTDQARAAPQASPSLAPSGPAVGDVIPPFSAQSLDGTLKQIDFPQGSTTLLLFFLSSCPHCQRTIPLWNEAYGRRSPGLTVVGVLLDKETPAFFKMIPVAFPVVRSPTPGFARNLKIRTVPVTLRIGGGGKVEEVGVGDVDAIRLGELFRP